MAQIATKQGRRQYPIIQPAERMPDMPEAGARARAFDVAGQIAYGLGWQFKRQQEEDRIETDKVSTLNAQVALDKYDYDELKRIPEIEFGQIEDFDNAYNEYNKGRQSYANTLLSGKTEDVQQSIKDHALKTELSSQSRYYNQLDRYKTRFSQNQFFVNQQQIAQNTSPDKIDQQKAAMLANIESYKDFFTPNQIESFKAAVDKNISAAALEFQRQELWETALASAIDIEGNVDWQTVLSFLNQPKNTKGVSPDEVDRLVENANTQYRIQTAVTDKPTYWDMLRKITKNPDEVTEDEIADKVGKGLTTNDYEKFMKIKEDKANPLKTPRAQIYMDLLADLYTDEEITPLEYDQKYTQLIEFMESKPTAQQAAAFWEEQMNPVAAKLADKVFDFYREYYKYISGYKAYEKLRGEPKEGEEDLTNMTDEELEAIIKGK